MRKITSGNGSTNTLGSLRKVSRKGEGKTLGTRAGTIRDWREASGNGEKNSGRRHDTTRDGR